MAKNKQNNRKYVRWWIINNPQEYKLVVNTCKVLCNKGRKVSMKYVITFLRVLHDDFKFCDGATRLLAKEIEKSYPSLKGKIYYYPHARRNK